MFASRFLFGLAAALLAATACATPSRPSGRAERVERRLVALGTWLEMDMTAIDRSTALAASEAALLAIEAVEERLSTWRSDSELVGVNDQLVGQPFALSSELAGWLKRSRVLSERTDGLFDPAVGELVELWGLRDGGLETMPAQARIDEICAGLGSGGWTLDQGQVIRRHPDARFEEGGFGKGAALEAGIAAALRAGATSIKLDLGGQLAFHGRAASVGVAHPRLRGQIVATLVRDGGSFATTGNSERGISVAGEQLGHVLDPRTGRPAEDWGSLTVWTAQALDADALSTGLYLMGPAEAIRWANANDDVEAVAIEHPSTNEQRVRVHASSAFSQIELDSSLAHFAQQTQPKNSQ